MASGAQMHWHEGLFLQPHHLQQLQRQQLELLAVERRLSWPYAYGVVEQKLTPDALDNMQVRFDRLRAIMPSGLEVDFPNNADLPALDIKRVFASGAGGAGTFTVYLGIPLYQPQRANTIEQASGDDTRIKRLYRLAETQVPDENTGENAQPVRVRRLNARLLTDGDDTTDLELLPLMKIGHGTGEESGLPRQDPRFIPPCFVIGGSTPLRNMIRDLANQIEATRKDLASQLGRGFSIENMKGLQFEQLLRLRTLNRYAARLPALALASGAAMGGATDRAANFASGGGISPFTMYLELREMLAELAGLYPDRDPFDAPRYDHDKPGVCFAELDQRIRQLLRGAVQKRYLEIKFVKDGGFLQATLTEEHVTQPNDYFLAFKTREDASRLSKLVEDADKFKLMPKSMVRLNIFGVKLEEERHPPLELPSQVGLHYFRCNRAESARMWEKVVGERALSIRWPEVENVDLGEVTLYMTVP